MAFLGHTPRLYDGSVDPIKYKADWWAPDHLIGGLGESPLVGHVCTKCGCFYVPTDGAVCSNKVMEVLKERVL